MGIIIWPGQTPDEDMPPTLPTWVEEEEALERAEIKAMIEESLEWKRTHDRPDAIGEKLDYLIEYCVADDEIDLAQALLLVGEVRAASGANGLLSMVSLILADIRKVQRCRVCGCTNDHACAGGCDWVAADLCSRCAEAEDRIIQGMH